MLKCMFRKAPKNKGFGAINIQTYIYYIFIIYRIETALQGDLYGAYKKVLRIVRKTYVLYDCPKIKGLRAQMRMFWCMFWMRKCMIWRQR